MSVEVCRLPEVYASPQDLDFRFLIALSMVLQIGNQKSKIANSLLLPFESRF